MTELWLMMILFWLRTRRSPSRSSTWVWNASSTSPSTWWPTSTFWRTSTRTTTRASSSSASSRPARWRRRIPCKCRLVRVSSFSRNVTKRIACAGRSGTSFSSLNRRSAICRASSRWRSDATASSTGSKSLRARRQPCSSIATASAASSPARRPT